MKPITVVIPYCAGASFEKTLLSLKKSALVDHAIIVSQEPVPIKNAWCHVLLGRPVTARETLCLTLNKIRTVHLLLVNENIPIAIEPGALERMMGAIQSTGAGMAYSDFNEAGKKGRTIHPLTDYQLGSIRDDFDFGAMILFSVPAIRKALEKHGLIPDIQFAGLYDLRLKVSIEHPVVHLPESLYSVIKAGGPSDRERIFSYVDPQNFIVQKEMERVFTDYLRKINVYLPPRLKEVEQATDSFPVEASVIIPVRNRKETISDAVKSALSQEADFPFNILVVDNHSTDGTTAILSDLARRSSRLRHIIPKRTDLGIGGCWNEALHHPICGRYAVQLDSDDLYSSPRTLQKIIDRFHQRNDAMVIGSYRLVNEGLEEIPPGLIDHREWSDENGHNNALRINGLGAPRAFNTGLMRKIGFQNVSYGEDYAAALRICREYRVGRIYESLYLCRRWSGNTDTGLSLEEANRNNAFKDGIRTQEMLARQRMNQNPAGHQKAGIPSER